MSDPALVPDVFATGIMLEPGDGYVRFTAFVDRAVAPGGPLERVVVARLVLPAEAARAACRAMARALAPRPRAN